MFNPSDEQQVHFAHYRADAIARDIEQRTAEAREKHPDHQKMIAEAMAYAWMLVGVGKWTREHVLAFEKRLLRR